MDSRELIIQFTTQVRKRNERDSLFFGYPNMSNLQTLKGSLSVCTGGAGKLGNNVVPALQHPQILFRMTPD